jgi:hypothetical protein
MQLFVVCVLTGAVQVRENVEYMAELQVLPSSTFRVCSAVFKVLQLCCCAGRSTTSIGRQFKLRRVHEERERKRQGCSFAVRSGALVRYLLHRQTPCDVY